MELAWKCNEQLETDGVVGKREIEAKNNNNRSNKSNTNIDN